MLFGLQRLDLPFLAAIAGGQQQAVIADHEPPLRVKKSHCPQPFGGARFELRPASPAIGSGPHSALFAEGIDYGGGRCCRITHPAGSIAAIRQKGKDRNPHQPSQSTHFYHWSSSLLLLK